LKPALSRDCSCGYPTPPIPMPARFILEFGELRPGAEMT
jgi:hypothetical protein